MGLFDVCGGSELRQTRAMTPLTLTEEQREFRGVVRQFAEDKLGPRAAHTDESGEFDWEAFKGLVALELPALGMPAEYGGSGADLVTQAIVAEELARVDASVSLMFLISKLGMLPVMNFGSEEMKRSTSRGSPAARARRPTGCRRPTPVRTSPR